MSRPSGEPLAGLGVRALDDDPATRAATWWLERLGATPGGGDVAIGASAATAAGDAPVQVEIGGPPGLADVDLWARSGLGWITRLVAEDGGRGGPAAPADREASVLAGTAAAIAALAALWAREATAAWPARLAVDRLEVLSLLVMQPLATVQIEGDRAPTLSAGMPGGVLATQDGLVYARPVEARQWHGLLARIPGLDPAIVERLADGDLSVLPERREAIDAALAGYLAAQPREAVVDAVQADHVPLVPVLRPDEVRADPHLAARGYEPGESLPWLLELGAVADAPPREVTVPDGASGPLAGLRVLDLTWAWAGPFATTLLADLGAEVVNVEWEPRFSNLRAQRPFPEGGGPPNASGWWSANQRGKRSVGLNFKHPDGIRLVHELARGCDVVLENFSPGVVDRLGIGHADLLADNPRLVYISMSAFGKAGPYAHYVGYGTHIHAASGAAFATGALSQMEIPYPDPVSGFAGALAALAYVIGARRTGRPAFLDVSELECTCALLATAAAEDAPGGPVEAQRPAEVLGDPWLVERGFWVRDGASGLAGHDVRIGGPLFHVDGARLPARDGAPDLFGHTRAVLAGLPGHDEEAVDRLFEEGAVR
jgi:crotonobetainyl-CoA:carnitine CoA-transferase CaiB-like acyl-CoA transferase